MNKVDILALGAHPDDVELSCSGTLIKHIENGGSAAIVDLTQGELGTRGSAELRLREAENSRKILGAVERINLAMPDGFFEQNEENKKKIVRAIRYFQPDIVLMNAPEDRHPDHGRSAKLEADACFLAGLRRIETTWDGVPQKPWRPRLMLHYVQDHYLKPDIVVDITAQWDKKIESIKAFSSQFYDPNSDEPDSPISGKDFFDFLAGRASQFGRAIGVGYAEGFITQRPVGVEGLDALI